MTTNVLIISTKADTATDAVTQQLDTKGTPYVRLNTETLPFQNTISYNPSLPDGLAHDGRVIPIPSSVWYRRVRTPPTPNGMDEGIANFCRTETRAALLGSLLGYQTRWMSHPANIWQAEFKPYHTS